MLSIVSIISLFLGVTDAYATHNSNLYVSAENPSFNNHFAGSMVIEVVVNDSDLKDIDDGIGEPDVTINGKDLRMGHQQLFDQLFLLAEDLQNKHTSYHLFLEPF